MADNDNQDSKDAIGAEDLEDGEIDDDDDDDVVIIDTKTEKYPEKSVNIDVKSKNDVPIQIKSNTMTSSKKSKPMNTMKDDWAGNVENAIAAALKKEGFVIKKTPEREYASASDNDYEIEKHRSSSKGKKRKKRQHEKKSKKRNKRIEEDEFDEDEMLCVRGGSPPAPVLPPTVTVPPYYESDSYNSYDSDDSQARRRKRKKTSDYRRKTDDNNERNKKRKRNLNYNLNAETEGLCIPSSRGFCDGYDECKKAHDCRPSRKFELCKFYLVDACAKGDKCSYMHGDFPCKYYYLGMECVFKDKCYFSHGKPLSDKLRNVLLKHIETAPKEILGNFRRISREQASQMMYTAHGKICAEHHVENTLTQRTSTTTSVITTNSDLNNSESNRITSSSDYQNHQQHSPQHQSQQQQQQQQQHQQQSGCNFTTSNNSSNIPSLFDIVVNPPDLSPRNDKPRKSRWCETSPPLPLPPNILPNSSSNNTDSLQSDYLSLKNLTGILTQEQIQNMAAMGIENLDQVNQLTVAQLNNLGLTISQINEIQLHALNLQKMKSLKSDLTTSVTTTSIITSSTVSSTYLGNLTDTTVTTTSQSDIPLFSSIPESINTTIGASTTSLSFVNPTGLYSDPSQGQQRPIQDIDMRFLIGSTRDSNTVSSPSKKTTLVSAGIASPDAIQPVKTDTLEYSFDQKTNQTLTTNSIDYTQYLKDSNLDVDKTDLNDISFDKEDEPELLIDESWIESSDNVEDKEDIKVEKSSNENTDDDNNVNDDDDVKKIDLPQLVWTPTTPSVTKILYTNGSDGENWDSDSEKKDMKIITKYKTDNNENSDSDTKTDDTNSKKFHGDPRLNKKRQGQYPSTSISSLTSFTGLNYLKPSSSSITDSLWSVLSSSTGNNNNDTSKTSTTSNKQRTSIYDTGLDDNDDENGGNGCGTDSSSCKKDKDMRMSSFLDSTNSDVDFRFPFKPQINYTPATEIDGSIASHNPIPWKAIQVDIPKPDFSEIRKSVPAYDKILDPRLRRMFRLKESNEENNSLTSSTSPNDAQYSVSSNVSTKSATSPISSFGSNNNSTQSIINTGPRMDPRRRKENQDLLGANVMTSSNLSSNAGNSLGNSNAGTNSVNNDNQGVDIRLVLQKSVWYKNLSSKFKIMVNQQLALVSTELKKFHQDNSPNKVFDMSFIANNQYLQQVLTNLCIYIDSNGQIKQLEGDNDEDNNGINGGMSSMPSLLGMGPVSGNASGGIMDNSGGSLMMPTSSQFTQGGMLQQGMYMRANAPPMNMAQRWDGNGVGVPQQFRTNMRPGLLGIAPGMQFNPNETLGNDGQQGYLQNIMDEPNMYMGGPGGNSGGFSGGSCGNLFDQGNYFNNRQNDNRGGNMRNNYRQGGMRNNQNRGGMGIDGGGRRNYNDNKNRRDKLQKL